MSDDVSGRRGLLGVAVLFGTIALFIGADLITDSGEGAGAGHLAAELVVLVAASFGLGAMLWRLGRLRRALADARQDAGRWQEENRELVQGLVGIPISIFAPALEDSSAGASIGASTSVGARCPTLAPATGAPRFPSQDPPSQDPPSKDPPSP